MHLDLLQWLKCIHCGDSMLACSAFKTSGDGEVEDGLLLCPCGASYPIISGVPRMLPAELSELVVEDHGWFFNQYADVLNERYGSGNHGSAPGEGQSSVVKDTARSFGYEWTEFSRMVEQYERNFQHYFEGYSPDFFRGKLVLDAGCGLGRHSYYAARYGAEVVGIDLSRAIDVAYQNNRAHTRAHFIQADLYHLPLRTGLFDVVYSLGVLHHLPNPESGFHEILRYLKDEGMMLIYVYGNLEDAPSWHRALLAAVTAFRKITTRTPHPLLKRFCVVFAALCYAGLITPARLLKKSGNLRRAAEIIPLHGYSESPFYAIYKDTFDRFSAPLERRYGRNEVLEWFVKNGLSDLRALGGSGWRVSGRKNSVARLTHGTTQTIDAPDEQHLAKHGNI